MDAIRVLHVDDDPRFGELVAEFLEREDDRFAVVTEASAGAGLDRLADGGIDCVVSDYDMPRTDGLSFLEAVREEHSDLPFVLFTGKGSEEIAGTAMAKGATEYLQKGGGTEQYELLANRVRNAVEQYRHERERDRVYQALETATQGIAIVDPEDRFVYLNGACADLHGYDPGDLVGERWERLSPAGAVERFRAEVRPVLRREGRWSGRSRGLRADGAVFPVRVSLTCLDGGGHVRVVQDLSEEERRRHRRQRQRDALLDLTTDAAVIEGDFEVAVRRITERAADVLDADRVNVWLFEDGGASLDCVDHYDRRTDDHGTGTTLIADDYPAYFDALEANRAIDVADARSDPRTAGLTDDYLEPNGVGALLDATLRSGGEVVGVVCHEHVGDGREWTDDEIQFAADVADVVYRALRNRQRADRQRELEFQRSLLEAQQEAMLDGLVVVDDEGEIISYNERFVDLWGIPESVVERGDDAALAWATDRLATPEEFREKVAYLYDHPGETSRDEIELADGRVFDRYSTPVTGDDGVHYGRLWMFRDVTDRRDRERRLGRQNEQFDELAEVVSHDLRMPVETVRGRLELARETGDPEHVADALAALERVDELRRELADVLRTRGVPEGTDRVDVGRVARSIWGAAAPPADASLRVDDGARVDADREALRRLLENLIGNSLEHGGDGVRIRIGPLDGGDGFYLADDGPGIPSENRKAVFDPGFSTKAEGEGVGMGMTSVRRIADAHGWTIEVGDSDALGGVRFEIRDPSSR